MRDAVAVDEKLLLATLDSEILNVEEPKSVALWVEDSVKLGTMDRVGVTYGW